MARTRIAELEVGRPAEGLFSVQRKQRRMDRNGDPFLVLELADQTGSIEGRVWDNADWFDGQVRVGDTVVAVGKPSFYRGAMQLDIRRIARADAPETAGSLVPMSRRPLEDLVGELEFLVGEIDNPSLQALVHEVWSGPDAELLQRSPATAGEHHAWVGGLVEHTVNVATICLAAAERHPRVDRSLVLTAALLHDIGRAREIEVGTTISRNAVESLEGHILLAHEMLLDAAARTGFDRGNEQRQLWSGLLHAISCHHGSAERCRSAEALTLLHANTLDVRLSLPQRMA